MKKTIVILAILATGLFASAAYAKYGMGLGLTLGAGSVTVGGPVEETLDAVWDDSNGIWEDMT